MDADREGPRVVASTEELADKYAEYTATVSPDNMAISLETSARLLAECRETGSRRVADFGSGFSSWTLGHYATTAPYPVTVVSVDTSEEWLGKTRQFIGREHHAAHRLMLWDEYQAGEYVHDLALYDLDRGHIRNQGMAIVAANLATDGRLIFDDAQHVGHRAQMVRTCQHNRMDLRYLQDDTTDSYGRFAAMGVRISTTPLEMEYRRACETRSDIVEHLPTFVQTVLDLDAQIVIELGTRGGVSTLAWLYGLAQTGGSLWSVDIDPTPAKIEVDAWTFVLGDDLDPDVYGRLPDLADIVFIDTSHGYDQTLAELHLYRWKVRPGGFIMLHDTELERPQGEPARPAWPVKTAIEEYCHEEDLTWSNRPNCYGLGTIEVP